MLKKFVMYLGVLLLIILFINTKVRTWACLVLRLVTTSENHMPLPCEVRKLSRCKGRRGAHPNAHYYHHRRRRRHHHHHFHYHRRHCCRLGHNHHPNVEVYF